ncbi:hypothetical protein ACHAWX_004570 [Stephanocyclus meneghinianus]
MTATRQGRNRGRGKTCPTHESPSARGTIEASSSAFLVANAPSQTKLSSSACDNDSGPSLKHNVIQLTPSSTPTKAQPQASTASSIMLTTPLKTLKLIEATILLNSTKMMKRPDSMGILSLEEWKAWAHAHEWLASSSSTAVPSDSSTMDIREQSLQDSTLPSRETDLMSTLSRFVTSFTEEERLLFDLLVVSGWVDRDSADKVPCNKHLYPLYRIFIDHNHKLCLEALSSPKRNGATRSRMDVLSERYLQSRTFFRSIHAASDDNNNDNSDGPASIEKDQCAMWWDHALKVARLIHANKNTLPKQTQRGADNQRNASVSSFVQSIISNKAAPVGIFHDADANPDDTAKKTSLEERVRARAALRESNNAIHRAKSAATQSNTGNDRKALLELANVLRHFSQRRGVSSRTNSFTASERLRSRPVDGGSSAADGVGRPVSARLSLTDFLNDARLCWNAVLRNSTGSGSSKGGNSSHGTDSRGISTSSVVNVDLSRVLFQLRLNMTYDADDTNKNAPESMDGILSDRRQMEKYLLNLLRELTVLVPNWICVSRIPSALSSSSANRKDSASSSNGASAYSVENTKSIIPRDSIIIIRNDTVDYNTDVRAKLGGTAAPRHGGRKRTVEGHPKEPQPTTSERHGNRHTLGPSVVADAIVPPSFRQRYGKVIESACVKAAAETQNRTG